MDLGAVLFVRLGRPAELPNGDTLAARMVRVLADDGSPPLAPLPADERNQVLLSLAHTMTRTRYHRLRFERIVRLLACRRERVRAVLGMDLLGNMIMFEAVACLSAARSAVDQIAYVAARRAGATPREADDDWAASKLARLDLSKQQNSDFNVGEVVQLQDHRAWFDELNTYRNVLVHRGPRESYGSYFKDGEDVPEASEPDMNVMLVPDPESLDRSSAHRPDKWTYTMQLRIEQLVDRLENGLREFVDNVASRVWGGKLPAPGTSPPDEEPDFVVKLPSPVVIPLAPSTGLLPMFTSASLAKRFVESCGITGLVLREMKAFRKPFLGERVFRTGPPTVTAATTARQFSTLLVAVDPPSTTEHGPTTLTVQFNQHLNLQGLYFPADASHRRLYIWSAG